MDYQELLKEIKIIAIEQGELLQRAFKNPEDVDFIAKTNEEWNGDATDVVTVLDKEVEVAFHRRLSAKFPELGFNLEEQAHLNEDSEYVCYIDPIDGTKYFANNIPLFCISVGVIKNGEPVLGMVYNPISEQMYAGAEGIPTTVNEKEVSVGDNADINKAILSLDMASRKENWESEKEWMIKKVSEFNVLAGRIRLFGLGALSCAWVAAGSIGGFVSIWGHGSKPYDIAAGKALIKYAGGKIVDLEIPGIAAPRFVGGNPELVDQICEILLKR